MRSLFFIALGLAATSAAFGARVELRQETDVDVRRLNKSEVSQDTATKAWFLDLEGVLVTNGSTGFAIDKDPAGLTLAVFPAVKQPLSRNQDVIYHVELGYAYEDRGPLGAGGRIVLTSAPSFLFKARLQLPAEFGKGDRLLTLLMPMESYSGEPAIPLQLAWTAATKTWKVAYGAVTSPPPFKGRSITLQRFAVLLDSLALGKVELGSPTPGPAPAVKVEGSYQTRRCGDGAAIGKLAAIAITPTNPQLTIVDTHAAKDGVLDVWGQNCVYDEPGTVDVDAYVRLPYDHNPKWIERTMAEWGSYSVSTRMLAKPSNPANTSKVSQHFFRLSLKKGETVWKLEKNEQYLVYP